MSSEPSSNSQASSSSPYSEGAEDFEQEQSSNLTSESSCSAPFFYQENGPSVSLFLFQKRSDAIKSQAKKVRLAGSEPHLIESIEQSVRRPAIENSPQGVLGQEVIERSYRGQDQCDLTAQEIRDEIQAPLRSSSYGDLHPSQNSAQGVFVIENKRGLHARPSAELVRCASNFVSSVQIVYKGTTVNAKSLISLLTLGAPTGSVMTVTARGSDAGEAIESIVHAAKAHFFVEY